MLVTGKGSPSTRQPLRTLTHTRSQRSTGARAGVSGQTANARAQTGEYVCVYMSTHISIYIYMCVCVCV
jgi:hypothetical protein